jgi:hypothetical protein
MNKFGQKTSALLDKGCGSIDGIEGGACGSSGASNSDGGGGCGEISRSAMMPNANSLCGPSGCETSSSTPSCEGGDCSVDAKRSSSANSQSACGAGGSGNCAPSALAGTATKFGGDCPGGNCSSGPDDVAGPVSTARSFGEVGTGVNLKEIWDYVVKLMQMGGPTAPQGSK